jgi:hypothetical protein
MVEAVAIADQRIDQRAQVKQVIPIGCDRRLYGQDYR